MDINIANPWVLLLLPICIAAIFGIARKRVDLPIAFSVLRSIVVTLVILALANVMISRFSQTTTTIFAVDLSASMEGNKQAVIDFLAQAQTQQTQNDWSGIVCFGEKAVIESVPAANRVVSQLDSFVDKDATNISDGLKLAQTLLPDTTRKRIVLVSDGLETAEDAVMAARQLKEKGIVVDVLPLRNAIENLNEVQLTEITIPKTVGKGMRYDIVVKAYATAATDGKLLIYKNNSLIVNQTVTLHAGENQFMFSDESDESGGVIYRAEIVSGGDTLSQNNTVHTYGVVLGEPRILLIDYDNAGSEMYTILQAADMQVERVKPAAAPDNHMALSIYDAVILANTSIEDLPEEFPAALESYVKNIGGGLVVIGGDNSYAIGGYRQTPLETVLPVDMELKNEEDKPNLGIIMVMDRSGSMVGGNYGLSKLELAKEAVIRSVDVLSEKDSIGVIAFDDKPQWASEYQLVGENKTSIQTQIASISEGGGTSIIPGLVEAYETLERSDTKLKHIILLTDGQAEQTGYDQLIYKMKENGITLSTVAVGSDADLRLLRNLAESGDGRYYFTNEFTDLPKIFAKETVIAGRNFMNHEPFFPAQVSYSSIFSGIMGIPELLGYVSTTAKDRADVLLVSPKQEPVLAVWDYGLGKAAAWTSDYNGVWSANWLATEEGVTIMNRTLSWALRKQKAMDLDVTAKIVGQKSEITLTMPYAEDVGQIEGTVISEALAEWDVRLEATAPGVFKGVMDMGESGAYIANFAVERESGVEMVSTGVHIPYSDEYNLLMGEQGGLLLNRIAEITGGRMVESAEDVFYPLQKNVYQTVSARNWLTGLAIVLFLLDVFIRRFVFVRQIFMRKIRIPIKNWRRIVDVNKGWFDRKRIGIQKSKRDVVAKEPVIETSSILISKKKKRMGR